MQNPYDKYIRMELLTLGLAVVIGFISIVQGYLIMMLFSLYLLAFSMFCEGIIHLNTNHTTEGIKQFVKGGMVMLLSTILLFQL